MNNTMPSEQDHELVKQLNKWSRDTTYRLRSAMPTMIIEASKLGKDHRLISLDTAAYRLLCLVGIRCSEFHNADITDAAFVVASYMEDA